jgi:hypothetical protein
LSSRDKVTFQRLLLRALHIRQSLKEQKADSFFSGVFHHAKIVDGSLFVGTRETGRRLHLPRWFSQGEKNDDGTYQVANVNAAIYDD